MGLIRFDILRTRPHTTIRGAFGPKKRGKERGERERERERERKRERKEEGERDMIDEGHQRQLEVSSPSWKQPAQVTTICESSHKLLMISM